MAESSSQDVELKTQSVGVSSPSDAPAITTENKSDRGENGDEVDIQENGFTTQTQNHSSKIDEQFFEDGIARSDTDTSRAGSVTGDNKTSDMKPAKKFAASKPVSFAKYSVPKTVTANAPPKTVSDKVTSTTPTPVSSQAVGRPRLVAKTTSSLQQKTVAYKPVAPDPMQVWNKNRVTPQQSTKHLTDEELKQQYGIHLTTRLQSDGEGKEAKWADIDDDEDDWAPETIEWNDGTKTTVNPAEVLTAKLTGDVKTSGADQPKPVSVAPKIVPSQYSSTVGPNATVLKVGANVERQQAQKAAAQQGKGPLEKPSLLSSKTAPAPTPVKSPWAKIPEVEKVSPIVVNPQPSIVQPSARYPSTNAQNSTQAVPTASPAKEMSADDFNRSWRNSPTSQTRELFMPSSGRYEAVSDGRRRMSRNDQNFRAPAVLQRPSQNDTRAPAEPSAAFQTNRTSTDQGRRRASSSVSGVSGQFARRMSFKSGDIASPLIDGHRAAQTDGTTARPVSQEGPSPQPQAPTYQARGGDHLSGPIAGSEGDIEAQRVAQKALMKENIERARKRKVEEEQRMEAEKQERIRAKLAALGPDPKLQVKAEGDVSEKEVPANNTLATSAPIQSPPKPPQPLATGEPQQYGMMKVHPMDSIKRISPTAQAPESVKPLSEIQNIPMPSQQAPAEKKSSPPVINGSRPVSESQRPLVDSSASSEPSPKFNKPVVSMGSDARAGWGTVRNDRAPPASKIWGLPHNKALGNGTFDQSLAGYSPQDLSRTSSTGQGWMNGRTPTIGQSPQLHHATHHVPETRSHLLQSMTSPDQHPLTLNSEVDSALPVSRPIPIGPPQSQTAPPNGHGLAAWNNFQDQARTQERADNDRFNRELNERREEARRTGVRPQASYGINETFKQVQLGDQVGQRHVSNVAQISLPPASAFGAVGSLSHNDFPSRMVNGQNGRGSRFFPPQANGLPLSERRAVTYSHPEVPRSPSPPPAEEITSLHPAFDQKFQRPIVHFPREKAVVRLPPAAPLAPPTPPSPVQEVVVQQPQVPLTWAARVSMSAPPIPPPPPSQRTVSQPIVQSATWQQRFNGLLGKTELRSELQPAPTEAFTKVPLDVAPHLISASVSLPQVNPLSFADAGKSSSKDVEDEEDLFEDREAGSLPTIHFPWDTPLVASSRPNIPRVQQFPVDATTAHMFMVNNWNERHVPHKAQYAIIKAPGTLGKGIRKDLPVKTADAVTTQPKPSRNGSGQFAPKYPRGKTGMKPRPTAKAH